LLRLLPVVSNKTRFLTILHASKQLVKRPCYASKVINESPVKVTESKEDLDIMVRLRWIVTPFRNSFNSRRVHTQAIFVDDEAKEIHLCLVEVTLSSVGVQSHPL
jgi:hypothetical protein